MLPKMETNPTGKSKTAGELDGEKMDTFESLNLIHTRPIKIVGGSLVYWPKELFPCRLLITPNKYTMNHKMWEWRLGKRY